MEWLASRQRPAGWIWGSLAIVGFFWLAMASGIGGGLAIVTFTSYGMLSLHALLKFWIAWEASRRFSEDRRNGNLELLLSTPLSLREIMRGHFNSLCKLFFGPVAVILILDLGLVLSVASWVPFPPQILTSFVTMMGMLVVDAFALAWLGLWAGLKMSKSWVAAFATLARIVVLPSAICMVMLFLFMHNNNNIMEGGTQAAITVRWGLIGGINSFFFGANAHWKLHHRFRQTVTQSTGTRSPEPPSPPESPELEEYFSLFTK